MAGYGLMRQQRLTNHYVSRARVLLWTAVIGVIVLTTDHAAAQDLRNGPLVTQIIGGNELRIPRNYFLPGRPRGERPGAILLTALLPELAPMRSDNMKEFLATRGFGRIVTILIHDASQSTALEFRLKVTRDNGGPYNKTGNVFGLDEYDPVDPGKINPNRTRPEIYVSSQGGKLNSFLRCDRNGTVPVPGCEHQFVDRNLLIQLGYGKTQLPNWRAIEELVKRLIDSFGRGA